MNSIRQTQALNKLELENAVPPSASWHADYRDTAYIYVGGLPFDVSEGDIVTIFSQFGTPTHVNLVRDKETGKSKGFAFLKYEDQRSCDLAVDNLGGAEVLGRVLRVDHTRYKKREGEDEEAYRVDRHEEDEGMNGNGKRPSEDEGTGDDNDRDERRRRRKKRRPMIREEMELEGLLQIKEGEEEDPMREYLIKEKRQEVEQALLKAGKKERKHKHRHRHHEEDSARSHKRRDSDVDSGHRSHRHRDRQDGAEDRHRRRRSPSSDYGRSRSNERQSRGHADRDRDRRRQERGHRD
jgi:RNA-binding motif protein, X-linked 2